MNGRVRILACAVVGFVTWASQPVNGGAQVIDSTRKAADTTVAPRPLVVQPPSALRVPTRLSPPLSPKRAFLYSALLPGFGQSRLDRGTSGALFASIEMAALIMVRRTKADLGEVRRYRIDTLPSEFTVGDSGTVNASGNYSNRYSADLERTRKLHVEDWLAVVAFNHLFAGADAFVAAQLWDTPISFSAVPNRHGPIFVATLRW